MIVQFDIIIYHKFYILLMHCTFKKLVKQHKHENNININSARGDCDHIITMDPNVVYFHITL